MIRIQETKREARNNPVHDNLSTDSNSVRDFEGEIESAGRASAADIFESAPLTFLIRDTGRPVRHLV